MPRIERHNDAWLIRRTADNGAVEYWQGAEQRWDGLGTSYSSKSAAQFVLDKLLLDAQINPFPRPPLPPERAPVVPEDLTGVIVRQGPDPAGLPIMDPSGINTDRNK